MKFTMALTFTSLPLNACTSVFGCGCGFGFEQNYWRIDGFGEKKARNGGFVYPPLKRLNFLRGEGGGKLPHKKGCLSEILKRNSKRYKDPLFACGLKFFSEPPYLRNFMVALNPLPEFFNFAKSWILSCLTQCDSNQRLLRATSWYELMAPLK